MLNIITYKEMTPAQLDEAIEDLEEDADWQLRHGLYATPVVERLRQVRAIRESIVS